MARSIVVVSHNVHPFPRSAEAIVTGALVDALRRHGEDVAVLTSPTGHQPLDGAAPLPPGRCWPVAPAAGLPSWRHRPARSVRGATARLVDRAGVLAGREPFSVSSWARPASHALLQLLDALPSDAVVWARGLPEASLAAARRARARRAFPLVCSLGDPLPVGDGRRTSTDGAVARVARRQVQELGRHADAWTFPSRRVLEGVARAGGLDPSRCFVVPHLLPDRDGPARSDDVAARAPARPEVVYAGSAYGWLLRGPLLPALERAAGSGLLQPVLALRDAGPDERSRVQEVAPSATVHLDLDPAAAAALVDRADAVLVPGPRPDLLYTKVVEALRHGRPVLAVTPVPGTTADLVAEAGGLVVDEAATSDQELDQALQDLAALATDPSRHARARRDVAERLRTAAVLDQVGSVLAFAQQRHEAVAAGRAAPSPPVLDAWP